MQPPLRPRFTPPAPGRGTAAAAPSSAGLGPVADCICAHETFCLGRGSPAFSNAAQKQFRVTGNFQPRTQKLGRGRGGRRHRRKVALGQWSPLEVVEVRGSWGGARTGPLYPGSAPRITPSPLLGNSGYFSQDVTSKWHNL